MNVSVVSHFRNAVGYLERYFEQMDSLKAALGEQGYELTLVLGYGDSTDGTGIQLYDECVHRFDARLIDVSHGGPYLGSIVHPERFRQLAYVGNKLWKNIPDNADIVGLVESDLIWKAQSFIDLLEFLQGLGSVNEEIPHLVAPMVMHQRSVGEPHLDDRFYDRWAFRYNGVQFKNEPPYHKALESSGTYVEMNSVGSFVLMDGKIAKQLCFPEEDVIVGFCRQARLLGARILLDKLTKVYHP